MCIRDRFYTAPFPYFTILPNDGPWSYKGTFTNGGLVSDEYWGLDAGTVMDKDMLSYPDILLDLCIILKHIPYFKLPLQYVKLGSGIGRNIPDITPIVVTHITVCLLYTSNQPIAILDDPFVLI